MSNYRQLHSRMWSSDNWFLELKPEYKLLFIYLFSNERASVCGLYEIPIRIISFETGLDRAQVQSAFEVFIKADKIKYDFEASVIWVKNMLKYQGSTSNLLHRRIVADIKAVPQCELKEEFVYWLRDTVSIPYGYGIYTLLSVSVSSSVSVSDLEEGGGTGEGDWIPETPKQAMEHPDIREFQAICGRIPGARDYKLVIDTIRLLYRKHGDNLVDELKPYWLAWSSRKNKNGRNYDPSSLVWLVEWAVNGEIPRVNGSEPASQTDKQDIIRKVAQNAKSNR